MEINLNFEELSPEDKLMFLEISFETFWGLINKLKGEQWKVTNYSDLMILEEKGFIKITSDNYDFALLEKAEALFGKKLDSLTELASKLIEIYPQGVKSGGYPVRGSKVDVTDKLRKFFKKHKYTHEQVIAATQKYVNRKREESWAYMQLLVHFIEKNNISNLAAEIDGMKGDNNGAGEDWTRNIK